MESVREDRVGVTGSREFVAAIKAMLGFMDELRRAGDRQGFRMTEARITELTAAVATAAKAEALLALEPNVAEVEVGEKRYRRLNPATRGRYVSLSGMIEIERHLYREVGVHNGPTVTPLELAAGIVEGLWTPEAAEAVAHLHQALPSREVAETCARLKVLPVSRATLSRGGESVGEAWERHRLEAEDELARTAPIPDEAAAVSVSIDRVTLPMEQVIDEADRTPDGPKIQVMFRQAYCATITVHDEDGAPVESVRYGRMPDEGHDIIEDMLAADIAVLRERRPDLRLVGLADGAPEMQGILDRVLHEHQPEAIALDFWHVIEKLSAAVSATSRRPADFIPKWKEKLLEDERGIEHIEVYIRTWLRDFEDDEVPDPLYDAFTYITNNRDRMRYARLRQASLPVGSGHVEATCKSLVGVRMKRSGSRWKERGGQACLNLRALALSSRWEPAMKLLLSTYEHQVTPVLVAA